MTTDAAEGGAIRLTVLLGVSMGVLVFAGPKATPETYNAWAFLPAVVSNGQVTLNWTGTGNLQWAPSVSGPWTAYTPAPAKPYSEAIVLGQNRFYRLQQ